MNKDSHLDQSDMSRLDKLELLVASLAESNRNVLSALADKSPRDLPESIIDLDDSEPRVKKPRHVHPQQDCASLNLQTANGSNKVSIKVKKVSSRSIPVDHMQALESVVDPEEDCASAIDNGDDLGVLENAFLEDEEDSDIISSTPSVLDHLEETFPIITGHDPSPVESFDIPIIGADAVPTWTPPPNAFAWFGKVADIGISDDQFKAFDEMYLPPASDAHFFEPPKLPPAIWDSVRQNKGATLKLKACHKAQSYVTSAVKPLLTVLESLDPTDDENRSRLAYAVQLLSTANLQFNRFKRAMAGPLIKKEFRKTMLSQPVTHNTLFGEDFSKTSELALKDVSSSSKILYTAPPFRKPSLAQSRSRPAHFRQTSNASANQASGSDSYSDKGRYNPGYDPYRGRGNRGRGRSSYRNRASGSGFRKRQ